MGFKEKLSADFMSQLVGTEITFVNYLRFWVNYIPYLLRIVKVFYWKTTNEKLNSHQLLKESHQKKEVATRKQQQKMKG